MRLKKPRHLAQSCIVIPSSSYLVPSARKQKAPISMALNGREKSSSQCACCFVCGGGQRKHKRGFGQMISSEGEMDAHVFFCDTIYKYSVAPRHFICAKGASGPSVVVSTALLLSDKTLCWNLVRKLKCFGHSGSAKPSHLGDLRANAHEEVRGARAVRQ